jgi:SulP family sulfate permease
MTEPSLLSRLSRWVPALQWGVHYRRDDLRPDVTAGLTVGAMLIPQGMAYAQLAGLPPEVGLYAVTLPLLVYALLGSSRQLAVGPVAVVSLLTAAGLAPMGLDPAQYMAAAAFLALLVGLINMTLGLARMGWLTNLLSHSVLVGFTAAAALIIAVSQFKHLLGVKIPRVEGFAETLIALCQVLDKVHWLSLGVGLLSLLLLALLKRWNKAFPGALAVVVLGVLASEVFNFQAQGVAVVGTIPDGMPSLALPVVSLEWVRQLLPMALTITLVGYMESIAVAKVYARKNRYDLDPNQELLALGASNLAAGVCSGQPVTGGFSRTAVNATAGARTALSSVVSALLIVLVLLFFTGLFTQLPQAVLGAIVVMAVTNLFDLAEMHHIARVKRSDALIMLVAFASTLALGVELGIGVSVACALVVLVARIMNPHSAEIGRLPGSETYRNVERFPEAQRVPHVGILRIDVSLNFINASFLRKRLQQLEQAHPEGLRHIILEGSGINDLDASGEAALADLASEYAERGIDLHLANMKGPVRDVLQRSGLWQRLQGRVHTSEHAAVRAIAGAAHEAQDDIGLDEHR